MANMSPEQIESQATNSGTLSGEQLADLVGNIYTDWHANKNIPWNSVELTQRLVTQHFNGNVEAAAKKLGINLEEFKVFGAFNLSQ